MQEEEQIEEVKTADDNIGGDVSVEDEKISEDVGPEEEIEHVVTEEDMELNPDLKELGVEVGDTVTLGGFVDEAPAEFVE